MDGIGAAGTATASALGGIKRAQASVDRTAARVAKDGDLDHLPEDLVDLEQAGYAVKANTAVIKAQDEMVGTLLDELG